MSEQREALRFFGPLKGWERALLFGAAFFAFVALLLLSWLSLETWHTYHGDFLTFSDAIGSIGNVMAGLAGTLFAFASSVLFFVALMIQLRDHRQSLEEMKLATANHKDALGIAREEKEFNVCLEAYGDLLDDIYDFNVLDQKGAMGLSDVISKWIILYNTGPGFNTGIIENYISGYAEGSLPLQRYNDVESILLRIRWLISAIQRKRLSNDDREYLHVLAQQLIIEVNGAIDERLDRLMMNMATLAAHDKIQSADKSGAVHGHKNQWVMRLKLLLVVIKDLEKGLRDQVAEELKQPPGSNVNDSAIA